MALAAAIAINHALSWIAFLAQTRYILSPLPPILLLILFAAGLALLGLSVKQSGPSAPAVKLSAVSLFLVASTQYVSAVTGWYVREIPDLIIYSFVHGSDIVQAYWTLTMLPAIPALFFLMRAANDALEEQPLLKRLQDLPFLAKPGEEDLVLCKSLSGKPVIIPGRDRYLNTIVVGAIGTGKSTQLLAPVAWQELNAIKKSLKEGIPRGLTVLEPKGDLVDKIAEMCKDLEVPYVYINPLRDDTARFNPLDGDPVVVAEATRTVLRSVAGEQKDFFGMTQEIAARNTILLLKYTRENLSLPDVAKALRVPDTLTEEVTRLELIIKGLEAENARLLSSIRRLRGSTGSDQLAALQREYDKNRLQISVRQNIVDYFRAEVFSKLGDKMFQFVLGLRLQLDDLAGNEFLFRVIAPRVDEHGNLDHSTDINLDDHLAKGGVLLVNSGSNALGNAGDMFGGYVMQHLQGAVFRRPGDETTRPRHTTLVDEVQLFIGTDYERMLSNGRSYRNENIIALQTTSQLMRVKQSAFRETIMNLCRNKVFFGGMNAEEAKYLAAELGSSIQAEEAVTVQKTVAFKLKWLRQSTRIDQKEKFRFTPTELMELSKFHVVYKTVKDNSPQPPGLGRTDLCAWDKQHGRASFLAKKYALPETPEEAAKPALPPSRSAVVLSLTKKKDAAQPPVPAQSTPKGAGKQNRQPANAASSAPKNPSGQNNPVSPEILPEDILGDSVPLPVDQEPPADLTKLYRV
jgi:polyhydroxyalkanoate synthesis regulator phasin